MLLSHTPVKTKGLVVLIIFYSSRAASSRGQHVSVWSPALLLRVVLFIAELLLKKLVMFCAVLGPAADSTFEVDALVLFCLFLPSCMRSVSAPPNCCCLHFCIWQVFYLRPDQWSGSVWPWAEPAGYLLRVLVGRGLCGLSQTDLIWTQQGLLVSPFPSQQRLSLQLGTAALKHVCMRVTLKSLCM